MKRIPIQKDKVTFISRQSNTSSIDFQMLEDELKTQGKKVVVLCQTLNKGLIHKIKYCFYMLKQMYHIATSKVVILDSYCIAVCVLKQKKELIVIQIWHALGSLKKFGYASLDKKDGRSSKIANAMKMHCNYTYILTSSHLSKPFFQEAFQAKEEQMKVMNLPRVDFLQSQEAGRKVREKFFEKYPEAKNNKENILYCPTKKENIPIEEMANQIPYEKYNFLVKLHDGTELLYVNGQKIEKGKYFTGMELLHVGNTIITDYSAICYEAAVAQKPTYFYAYDYDNYKEDRGYFIDYQKEMPRSHLQRV